MMAWKWGVPKHECEVRAFTGESYYNGVRTIHTVRHQVRKWYGLSANADIFIGVMLFGTTVTVRLQDDEKGPGD